MAEETTFVMEQPATFKWPVKVPIPRNGAYEFAEFIGEFPNMSEEDVRKLLANDAAGMPTRSDREVASDVLVGFSGITRPDGSQETFCDINKARFWLRLASPVPWWARSYSPCAVWPQKKTRRGRQTLGAQCSAALRS
jgi:hypothetical protein